MLYDLTVALLVCLTSGAAVLFVRAWYLLRQARIVHKRAIQRWRRITHDYAASKLQRNTWARGAASRDGEIRWFALKWEGEHERAEEYLAEVLRLRAQYVDTDEGKPKRDRTKIQIERDTQYWKD